MTTTINGPESSDEEHTHRSEHLAIPKSPITPSSPGTTAVASQSNTPRSAFFTPNEWDERPNVDEDLSRPLPGWPQVAKLIADYPDFEAFPAYRDLNIKSLLYYQAELDWIREKLHSLEWENNRNVTFERSDELGGYFDALYQSGEDPTPGAKKQWQLVQRMRTVLKEYNEALLQYSQISALPEADHFNVNSLRKWLSNEANRNIHGYGAKTWGDLTLIDSESKSVRRRFLSLLRSMVWPKKTEKNELDLIVPRAGQEYDGLTRWVANEFVPFWQCLLDRARNIGKSKVNGDEESISSAESEKQSRLPTHTHSVSDTSPKQRKSIHFPPLWWKKPTPAPAPEETEEESFEDAYDVQPLTLNTYTEDRMVRFTSFIATVIACLLPTVAITVLAKLHTMASILGLIAVFTSVFAVGLMLLTNAGTSRVEIFTATAAFSAVMVVFVQNQGQSVVDLSGVVLNITGTKG